MQSHLLDSRDFKKWSKKFSGDGIFEIGVLKVKGPKNIYQSAFKNWENMKNDMFIRRHNICTLIKLENEEDNDLIKVAGYANVVSSLKNGETLVHSTLMIDLLDISDKIQIVHRKVYRDFLGKTTDIKYL